MFRLAMLLSHFLYICCVRLLIVQRMQPALTYLSVGGIESMLLSHFLCICGAHLVVQRMQRAVTYLCKCAWGYCVLDEEHIILPLIEPAYLLAVDAKSIRINS